MLAWVGLVCFCGRWLNCWGVRGFLASYKVGEPFTAKYNNPPLASSRQYKVGQRVDIVDNETKMRLAVFVVEQTNENEASGKIVNTYGNKRKRRMI